MWTIIWSVFLPNQLVQAADGRHLILGKVVAMPWRASISVTFLVCGVVTDDSMTCDSARQIAFVTRLDSTKDLYKLSIFFVNELRAGSTPSTDFTSTYLP